MNGRQAEAITASARDLVVGEDPDLAGAHVGGRQEQLDRRQRAQPLEVDRLLEHVLQRVVVGGIELIGRQQPAHDVEHQEGRRVVERVVVQHPVDRRGLQRRAWRAAWLMRRQKPVSAVLAPVAAALGQAVGQHHRVHRPGAGGGDALERDALVLEQAVEHAPGEGAVGAAALQGEVDRLDLDGAVAASCRARVAGRSIVCVSMAVLPDACVSVRGPAAVDRQRRAGDRGGARRAQEHGQRAQLLDGGEALVGLVLRAARRGSPARAGCRAPWPGRRSASRPAASRHSPGRWRCR